MEVFVEHRNSSFEDHLSIVESGREKTASTKVSGSKEGTSLLDKLAAELSMGAAPVAEGEKEVSTKDVAGVAPAVDAATKGVTDPQVAVAGGDVARMEAGMVPHLKGDINTPVAISAGTGDAITAEKLNRTPEAVAAAARDAGGSGDTEKEASEAVKVGELIARSFQQTLEKDASDAEYAQSLNILDQAGLLANYNITDQSITKTASVEEIDVLEKIANAQPLTRDEIVLGAKQYLEVEKLAAQADAEGRAAAHQAVDEAMENEKTAEAEKAESEKIASYLKDEKVVAAVKVLKEAGVL
jgi:hypothetical protein